MLPLSGGGLCDERRWPTSGWHGESVLRLGCTWGNISVRLDRTTSGG